MTVFHLTMDEFLNMTPVVWCDMLECHIDTLNRRAGKKRNERVIIANNADELPQGVL